MQCTPEPDTRSRGWREVKVEPNVRTAHSYAGLLALSHGSDYPRAGDSGVSA